MTIAACSYCCIEWSKRSASGFSLPVFHGFIIQHGIDSQGVGNSVRLIHFAPDSCSPVTCFNGVKNITDNGQGYGQHIGCAEIVKEDTRIKDKF